MAPIHRTQDASQIKDDDNDQVRIVVATQEHREGLIRLMRDAFLPREPVEASLGTTWEEAGESLIYEVDDILTQPYSFVAVHSTEGVVGCRTCRYITIDPGDAEDVNDIVVVKGDAPNMRIFQKITMALMDGYKTEMLAHNFRSALEFITLCVDERFSNRGLARKLIEASLQLAERLRCDCAFALATNQISQRVLGKSGFVPWRTLYYEDILDENGNPYVIPNEGTKCIQWVVKPLRHSMAG